jgi:hypothetical protein
MRIFKKSTIVTGLSAALILTQGSSVFGTTVDVDLPPPGDFSTVIDNQYWPLPVGASFSYFAETEDGCEYNKLTVTSATREIEIEGETYTTLEVRDQEWEHEPEDDEECDPEDATMVEDTLDFYAQDSNGNIWYFGEDTWSIDDESDLEPPPCTDDGAWLAGEDDAEPGTVMLGDPRPGDRYQQEYWEDEAEDWGAVQRLNAKLEIEWDEGEFDGCLMTREWTPLEPGEIEHKFYCPEDGNPGPGLMLIKELKGKTVRVEYAGPGPVGAPGEFLPFPALEAVGSCELPD